MPKPSGPSAAEHSPVSASGRRATTASKSASGRSSLTGKHPSLPKGLGTAAVRVVVKRLPQSKLSTLGRESARSVAATRIQAAARGMLVRRRLPVSGYLQMRATRFPYRWRRRFVSLELSTATLVWSRQPGRRPLGTVVVRGCARSAHATHGLVLRCSSAGGANGRGGGGELQLRLRAASAASAEEWARALARAAATVAMAAARGNDGGGTGADADADAAAAPFVPSAVVPRLEEVGLAIRLVGRKPAGFALGKGQLHLHVRGAQFWKALEGVVPAAALRVARATLLPLPLIPDYLPADAFAAGTEAVDATLLLRRGDKPKAKSTAKLLEKLRANHGDPPLTLELGYRVARGAFAGRGVLLTLETTPGKLLDAARAGHSLIGSGGGGGCGGGGGAGVGGGGAAAAGGSALAATTLSLPTASGTGASPATTPPASPARSPLRGLRRGTSSRGGGGAKPPTAAGRGQLGSRERERENYAFSLSLSISRSRTPSPVGGSRPPSPVAPPAI